MRTSYDVNDLIDIKKGRATLEDVARKYNVDVSCVRSAMSYYKIYTHKIRIKIITPYKVVYVNSEKECAETLHLSTATIRKALRGKPIPTLETLNIKLEVVDNG